SRYETLSLSATSHCTRPSGCRKSPQLTWSGSNEESYCVTRLPPVTDASGLTHASTVIAPVMLMFGLSGISTRSSTPSRPNPVPTLPGADADAPFRSDPTGSPRRFPAEPSPGHQPRMCEGGFVQLGV